MKALFKLFTLIFFIHSVYIAQNSETNEIETTSSSLSKADSVIAKYIQAVGGREKLESVEDKKTVLQGEVQGLKLNLTIYQKAPNMYYQKMEAGNLQQETRFDGENGIQITSGRQVPIIGDQLSMMKVQAILNPQLNFAKLGITTEYSKVDTVNWKPAHEIIINLPSGKQWLQYYDLETGYIVKQISSVDTERGTSTVTSTYNDYREIDGIMYAHKITQSFGAQIFELTLSECLINTGLGDDLFSVE
jgi:zinc protease